MTTSAEEVLGRLKVRVRQEITLLTGEHLKNLLAWRTAMADYESARDQIVKREMAKSRRPSRKLAEQRAAAHPDVRDAMTLTSFYRDQAHMCADSLAVLYKVREDRFQ